VDLHQLLWERSRGDPGRSAGARPDRSPQ
jgi:hypothetical protein